MGKKSSKTYYAVRVGRNPGIYQSWHDCEEQVRGYSRAEFKGFSSIFEAQAYLQGGSALHSLHPSSPAQPAYQYSTAAAAEGSEAGPSDEDPEYEPKCPDCKLCHPAQLYRLEFDGGARGNPGPAGAGAVLVHDATGKEVGRVCEWLGHATNNVAEYTGLLRGLEAALASGAQRIKCLGDSKLVVEQVNGRWQVRNPGLQPLYAKVISLKECFDEFSIGHVYRDSNKIADALSNDAMDGVGWDGFKEPAGRIRKLEECPRRSRPKFEGAHYDEPPRDMAPITGMGTARQGNSFVVQGTHPQMPAQMPIGQPVMMASPHFQQHYYVG